MHKIDNNFIEEYKKLNRLCGDIFGSNDGVNDYLAAMDKKSYGAGKVEGWRDDMKLLKHLRHIRNQIAHDDTSANKFSTNDDLRSVKDFYRRIQKGKDPLAVLAKMEKSKRGKSQKKSGKKLSAGKILLIVIIVLIVVFAAVLLITRF